MKVPGELLMAYVDGELDAADSARVEQAMRDDAETANAVASARALRERLRQAYAPVLDEPVPDRLLAAAMSGTAAANRDVANVVTPGSAREPGHASPRARRLPHWAALAASLVLGVLLASLLDSRHSPSMLDASGGGLVASGELARSLDSRLTADGPDGKVSVGLSFRDSDGRFCRTFSMAGSPALGGLACRDERAWRVAALGEAHQEPGELRQAATALSPAILAEVDARMQGEPLDEAGERRARKGGWRQGSLPGP